MTFNLFSGLFRLSFCLHVNEKKRAPGNKVGGHSFLDDHIRGITFVPFFFFWGGGGVNTSCSCIIVAILSTAI